MIANVQVLRFVAATLVVWVHAQDLVTGIALPLWVRQLGFGRVDLFFVISGFITVRSTQGRDVKPLVFLKRRIRRIVPLYYVFTFLTFAIALIAPSVLKSTTADGIQLLKSLAFIPFEKTPDRLYPIYYLGWTLDFEMFFYAVYAAALLLPRATRVPALVTGLVALAVAGTTLTHVADAGVVVFFYTRPIVLDLALGMLIATWIAAARPPVGPALGWAFLAGGVAWFAFGTDIFSIGAGSTAPMTDTFLRFGLPAGLILAGAVRLEQASVLIGHGGMRRGGDVSYSIYLAHFYPVGLVIAAADRLRLGDVGRLALLPLTITAAVLVGFAVYYLVERPLGGDRSALRRLGGLFRPAPA